MLPTIICIHKPHIYQYVWIEVDLSCTRISKTIFYLPLFFSFFLEKKYNDIKWKNCCTINKMVFILNFYTLYSTLEFFSLKNKIPLEISISVQT
jgi:hypothetical protein